jgi:hypothetical protein
MWRPTETARRDRPFESECARGASEDARVTPPVVASVRALLPELDERAAKRSAVRVSENTPGEYVASADARTLRCRRVIRLKWASPLRLRRAARRSCPWLGQAGPRQPQRPHDRGGDNEFANQAVTSEEPSASQDSAAPYLALPLEVAAAQQRAGSRGVITLPGMS